MILRSLFALLILVTSAFISVERNRSFDFQDSNINRQFASSKTGIYTGSFDPPTIAHRDIAREFIRQAGLNKLIIGVNKFGSKNYKAGFYERVEMLRLMMADQKIEIEIIDVDGNKKDLLTEQILKEEGSFYKVIGEDSFESLPEHVVPGKGEKWFIVPRNSDAETVSRMLKANPSLTLLDTPQSASQNISSSRVRDLIIQGQPAVSFLDPRVDEYIRRNNLYSPLPSLMGSVNENMRAEAFENLKQSLARKFPNLNISSVPLPEAAVGQSLQGELEAFISHIAKTLGLKGDELIRFSNEAEHFGYQTFDENRYAQIPGLERVETAASPGNAVSAREQISLTRFNRSSNGETYHLNLRRYVSDRVPDSLVSFLNGKKAETFLHNGIREDALAFHRKQGFTDFYKVQSPRGQPHRQMFLATNSRNEVRFVLAGVNGLDRREHVLTQIGSSGLKVEKVNIIQHVPRPFRFLNAGIEIRATDELVVGYQNAFWRTLEKNESGWEKIKVSPPDSAPVYLYSNENTGRRIFSARPEYGDEILNIVKGFYDRGVRDFTYVGTAGSISSRLPVGSVVTPDTFSLRGETFKITNLLRGDSSGGIHGQVPAILDESEEYLKRLQAAQVQSLDVEGAHIADFFRGKNDVSLRMGFLISDTPLGGGTTLEMIKDTDRILYTSFDRVFDLWQRPALPGCTRQYEILAELLNSN